MVNFPEKTPSGGSQLGELVIRVHLPIICSQIQEDTPDEIVTSQVAFFPEKKALNGGSQLGELFIRVSSSPELVFSMGNQFIFYQLVVDEGTGCQT